MKKEREDSALGQIADELKVQAWLARAEFRNPSLHDPEVREEMHALARTRDELRLQLHLGTLEAKDAWTTLEQRWSDLKRAANETADDMAERAHDLLREIRDGYARLGDG